MAGKHKATVKVGRSRINDYSKCANCANGTSWQYGLFICNCTCVPVEDCLKRKIECVNFKKKEDGDK